MLGLVGTADVDGADHNPGFDQRGQGKRNALSAAPQPSRHFLAAKTHHWQSIEESTHKAFG
jgi:hypothetical protein